MPLCPYYPGVRIKRALRENVRNTCFIDIKTKADSFTNQGSVEVCGKAVNRGGGLGMEIPCVYIFDGLQWLDASNNPAIREEDDPGTARSKKTTCKWKKVKGNDWNKKPREWNVCNRRLKTIRSTRVRQTVQNQICHATLLLFFLVL